MSSEKTPVPEHLCCFAPGLKQYGVFSRLHVVSHAKECGGENKENMTGVAICLISFIVNVAT